MIRVAFKNLMRNPRRTATVLLTVAMGSGSLFLFHGFNAGIMNQYLENTVHSRYGHGQIQTSGYRETVYEKPWEHWITDWESLKNRISKVEGVTHLFPRVEFFALLTNGKITVSGRGQGVDGVQESQFFTTLNVEQGATLSDQPDGILLGKGLARALDVKIGDRVTVLGNTIYGSMNAADLTVVGVFHTGSKDFDDVVFRIPLQQAHTLLDTDRLESVALGLASVGDWAKVEAVVKAEFPTLEATPFAVLDKVYYQHSVDWLGSQFAIIQLIILAVVVLGIFNTVSTSVLERKQEIGNLRANGESSIQIMQLLSWEGVALGVLGAAFGILLAFFLNATLLRNGILMPPAPGITRQFHVLIEFQWSMAIGAFLMGAFSAMAGTVLAGLRVAKMPIGEALRSV
ncbi:MAG: hypothetical protein A2X94_10930 [Bdellovibrionales bacterium GWB1_55_8]|nr:MAG: hypothetical protein A2X94_10930 [Bdellovibrionales bacterium GWB1_55_8]